MSRKEDGIEEVNTTPQKKKKKKKKGCLGCFFSFIIINLVLIVAIVGAGYGLGNKYSKQYLGVSLPDAFKVVKAVLKGGDREKIVINAPTEGDEASFYGVVDEVLLLKEGTVTKDTIKLIADTFTNDKNETAEGGETESQPVVEARLAAENGDVADSLFSIISRENADYERLAKFDADYDYALSYEEDFLVVVSDRQLMAMLKSLLDEVLSSGSAAKVMKYVSLDQLVLKRTEDDKPYLSLTASAKVKEPVAEKINSITQIPAFARKLVLKMIPKEIFIEVTMIMGDENETIINVNGMNDATHAKAMKIADGVLKLTGSKKDAQATLDGFVNDYAGKVITTADEKLGLKKNIQQGCIKLDLFSALSSALFKDSSLTGADLALAYTSVLKADAEEMIKQNEESLFEDKYLVELDNGEKKEIYSTVPVTDGTAINYRDEFMHEFSAKFLMRTSFYRENIESERIYLKPAYKGREEGDGVYDYENVAKLTVDGVFPLDGESKPYQTLYVDGEGKITTDDIGGLKPIDLLEFVELEFGDIAALMGMGNSDKIGKIELKSLFDGSGMRKPLYHIDGEIVEDESEWFVNQARTTAENPDQNLTFILNEKMLGALVDEKMKDIVTGENELLSSLKLRFTGLYKNETEETVNLTATAYGEEVPTGETVTVRRSYMTVGFTADAKAVFGDNEIFPSLVGETIALAIRLEITPELEDKYLEKAKIFYADLGEKRTDELLATLEKANLAQFDVDMMNDQISKPIRDMISTIKTTLGSVDIATKAIEMPDVFSLLTTQIFVRDESKKMNGEVIEFTPDELHEVLKDLYDLPPVEYLEYKDMGREYHFLTNGSEVQDGETEFHDVYNAPEYCPDGESNDCGADHRNYPERVIHLNHLYELQSDETVSKYISLPALTSDLGEVVGYYDSDKEEQGHEFFTFEYHLSNYLDGAGNNSSLLDLDTIFATFRVDKEHRHDAQGRHESEVTDGTFVPVAYKTTLIINTMDAATRESVLKMIVYLSSDENVASKFADVEKQIGELAYTLDHNPYAHEFINDGKITVGGIVIYQMHI